MKKTLSIAGAIFLVFVVTLGVFFGYAAYQGPRLDASSKAYIEADVPPILSTWSKGELLKRSSPQLLKVLEEDPERLDQLFERLSKLGALKSFGEVKGDSSVVYKPGQGKTTTAAYTATARFQHGDARLRIRLIQNNGQWQILLFNVNSPILLQ